ncbi:MAG: hypothetical protein JW793_01975 [Acidobacteria bacterium]|nr:hypothetical protein [Acidobacteriota bacterium]
MRNYRWILWAVSLLWSFCAFGQQRPLITDDAEILPVGRIRVEFGAEFLQGRKYSLSGLEGDLTRLGVASIQAGVGEYAEFRISGTAQEVLSVQSRSEPAVAPTFTGDSTHDFGNLELATKLKILGEKGRRPAMAFKFAVELPNASRENGLGNDQTQFYAGLLFKKRFGRVQALAELGMAILGSPVEAGKQTDPFTYGFGAVVSVHRRLNLVAGIDGRQGPERVGNENRSLVRAGMQLCTGSIRWDLAGMAGLKRYDPDSGIIVGVTYEFQAFRRNKEPVQIIR